MPMSAIRSCTISFSIPYFTDIIEKTQQNWRVAIATAINHGVAVPAFSASLAYFDSYR